MMFRKYSAALLVLISFTISGCQFEKMEASEYGVVFERMPRFLGGGLKKKVLQPGEMEAVFFWEELYRFDTSVQSISWGGVGQGDKSGVEDYVETRALDGNEVGLAITIHYKIDPTKVRYVLQNVGTDHASISKLVAALARADIRTHMNVLQTHDFFNADRRQEAVEQVKEALNRRLNPEGIIIESVIYNDHRFERRLANSPDGTNQYDRKYQELIDQTQATNQKTAQEEKRIAAVREKKRREFSEEQARVNRRLEEAEGHRSQAKLLGDGYLKARENDAAGIKAFGLSRVEGMKKGILALSGPGGKAMLRLHLKRELLKANPKFVVINSDDKGSMGFDFNRVDTNQLLEQTGIAASMASEAEAAMKSQPKAVVQPVIKIKEGAKAN